MPLKIDWGAARQAQRPLPTNVHVNIQKQITQANLRVPVVAPTDPDIVAKMKLIPRGDFFTLRANVPKMAMVLTGSAHAFQLPPGAIKNLPPGGLKSIVPPDGILRTPGGEDGTMHVSFVRFGVPYSITLECDDGAKDPRCSDENYVRGLIQRLVVILPSQEH